MDEIQFAEQYLTIESDHKLWEKKIRGVYYWELIRFDLYYLIVSEKFNTQGTAFETFSNAKYLLNLLKTIPTILSNFPFRRNIQSSILVIPHPRRLNKDSVFWDIYSDPYFHNPSPSET